MSSRVHPSIFLFMGLVLAAAAAFWSGWPGPLQAIDVTQTRINTVISAPPAGETVVQTFKPDHNGLFEVSVRVTAPDPPADRAARSTITVVGPDGHELASRIVRDVDVDGTLPLSLSFPPQKNAQNNPYQITFEGHAGSQLALQGYTLNTLVNSALHLPESIAERPAQVLYLQTRYNLSWVEGIRSAFFQAGRWWKTLAAAIVLIPFPGAFLLSWRSSRWPLIVRCGAAWAAGIAIWPLLWVGLTAVGGRWSPVVLGAFVGGGWMIVGWRSRDRITFDVKKLIEPLAFALFLAGVLGVRLVAVRDAATLPWVDAGRHALITTIMREQGQFLTTYRPLLAVDFAPYHYGLHTLTAGVGLLLPEVSLTDLLPAVMQLLSTVICLAVYSGSWLLTGRRAIGWGAAFLVGLPFFFPGYYTTWGRLTQLAGLIVLAVLIGVLWRLRIPNRQPIVELLFVGLTAGLFFIHIRVFLLFLPLWALVMLVSVRPGRWRQAVGRWVRTASGVGVLTIPRLLALTGQFRPLATVRLATPDSNANSFPTGYITTGWEIELWVVAAAAVALLLAVWVGRRRPDRVVHGSLLLALWIAVLGVLTGGSYLHPRWPIWLPQVTLNSAYISLFVPQAMIIAAGAWWMVRQSLIRGPLVRAAGLIVLGGGLTAATLFGTHQQAGILNNQTLLVQKTDLDGIAWVDDHLPADALIAHSSWEWLPRVWAGQDGGSWLLPLTGRRVTTPPIDHVYDPDGQARTIAFNTAAADINDWGSPAAGDLLDRFKITHVFIGVRSGGLDPAALASHPDWEIVFHHGGTFVLARLSPPPF